MTEKIPPEIEEEIIRLYISGLTRSDIGAKTGVSTGSISNIVSKYSEDLGKPALESLRRLAVNFRNIDMTAVQAFSGARVYGLLQKLGINDDELHTFLSIVYNGCTKIGFKPDKLVEYAERLLKLQASCDIPIEEIPPYCEKLVNEKQKLQEEIVALEHQMKRTREECGQAIEDKKITIEILQQYTGSRDALTKLGVEIEDLPKLANMLNQAAHMKYNITEIIEHISDGKLLGQRLNDLQLHIEELSNEEQIQRSRLKDLKEQLDSNQTLISQLEELNSLGANIVYLKKLHGIINDIAKARKIDAVRAMQKFEDDITNQYDNKLGFEEVLKNKKDEISLKSNELNSVKLKLENLELRYRESMDALHTVRQLESNGINPMLIVCWNKILTSSHVSVENLEQDLQAYGNLKTCITKQKSEINRMKLEARRGKSTITTLANQREELQASIKSTTEFTIRQLKDSSEEARSSISAAASSTKDSIKSLRAETLNSIDEIKKHVKLELENTLPSFDAIVTRVSEASEELGRIQGLKPILRIIAECTGEKHEVYSSILVLLDRFQVWLQARHKYTYSIESSAQRLVSDIKEEMKRIAERKSD